MATRLFDGKKLVEIRMRTWDGNQYTPDWSNDFFEVGSLKFNIYMDAYDVDDVDYCIDQANDWKNKEGDFYGEEDVEGIERDVDVEELEFPKPKPGVITVADFVRAANTFGFGHPVVTAIWNTMESNPDNEDEFETVYAMWANGKFGDGSGDAGDLDTAVHRSVKEICKSAGMSQNAVADHFRIPRRTFGNWCTGTNECPEYTKLMIQELLGLYRR